VSLSPSETRAAEARPLQDLSAREALGLLAAGAFSPSAYVEALLDWQTRWTALNAYTQQHVEAVRKAAQHVRSGASPIAGLPVAVKDNIDVAGYATTAGTPGLKHHLPNASAPLVQRLLDRGVVVTGKTGLHEMAAGGTCADILFGPIGNPYDVRMVPGGSSGGSAAAVAARLVPAALGTDTAGSVRAPAALCGCVGFRPTTGRYDRVGLVPGDIRRDTMGWLARSCADIELLDAFSGAAAAPAAPVTLKGLRLGAPRAYFYEALDPTLEPVIQAALGRLQEAGVEIVDFEIPDVGERLRELMSLGRDLARDLQVYIDESGAATSPDAIIHAIADPQLRAMLGGALAQRDLHDDAYRRANDIVLPAFRQSYADCFARSGVAALVFPTSPEPAYPIPADIAAGGTGPVSMIRNTLPGAHAGLAALSLPAGLTSAGLPVGLELDGPPGSDLAVLAIGRLIEAILPQLPPPTPPA
jgi:Asp-tRNA(Asn)/Glu-tRNA(Gln) amidotransferase A subunit family amidase